MKSPQDELEDLTPLSTPVFQILLALADADRHGYAIMQEVEERTEGTVCIGPGTLYGAIKRLRANGLIEERLNGPGSGEQERRRVYHLTGRGRALAVFESRRLERLVESARAKCLIEAGS
jgi:DNA-binding PadR family transcriptional regulator